MQVRTCLGGEADDLTKHQLDIHDFFHPAPASPSPMPSERLRSHSRHRPALDLTFPDHGAHGCAMTQCEQARACLPSHNGKGR